MENQKNKFNRRAFLETVVREFINKRSIEDVKTAYKGFLRLMDSEKTDRLEINNEKRRILEKCLDIFESVKFRESIEQLREERNPSLGELVQAVTKILYENILGDRKRKYDMAGMNYSDMIVTGSGNLQTFDGLSSGTLIDNFGHKFIIQEIGTLTYSTPAVGNESLKKYRITKIINDSQKEEFEIFSNINFSMLEQDPSYRYAVLNELLSKNNVELSNADGYVGEIVGTKNSTTQLKPGEQLEDENGFYRYQISSTYALEYDSQDLSAVVDFTQVQAQKAANKKGTER